MTTVLRLTNLFGDPRDEFNTRQVKTSRQVDITLLVALIGVVLTATGLR